jgi:pimeloyl-ACP methyl ester carboxylesterase
MTSYSFVALNNTRFHYDVQGDGPALVLIHAGIADLRMWDDQMVDFSRHFTVIRYDVRGWGQTPFPSGEASNHEDLRALLAHLGHDRAHVLGCSNGGRIALDFTLAYPEMVDRLVLVGTAVGGYEWTDPETAALDQAMEQAYLDGDISRAVELDAQLWVDGLYRRPDQVNLEVRRRAVELLEDLYALPDGESTHQPLDPPALGRLAEIRSPTLVLAGDLDTPDVLRIASILEEGIAGAQRATFQGAAHLPNMEQPEAFNRVVLNFLEETSG